MFNLSASRSVGLIFGLFLKQTGFNMKNFYKSNNTLLIQEYSLFIIQFSLIRSFLNISISLVISEKTSRFVTN